MKNMNDIARKITLNETGKVQISIGQTKEVMKLFALICHQDPEAFLAFVRYGEKVSKREEKKNAKR